MLIVFFFFGLTLGGKAFASTIPGGSQALIKEFSTRTPQVIQGAIKIPQSDGHKGVVATRTQDVRVYGSP